MPGGGSKQGEHRGGRKKGTRNRVTIQTREELRAYCQSVGADPGKTLVDLMQKARDPKLRYLCADSLLDRLLPKLKSIEVSGDPEKPVHLLMDRATPAEREARQQRIAELTAKREGLKHVESVEP